MSGPILRSGPACLTPVPTQITSANPRVRRPAARSNYFFFLGDRGSPANTRNGFVAGLSTSFIHRHFLLHRARDGVHRPPANPDQHAIHRGPLHFCQPAVELRDFLVGLVIYVVPDFCEIITGMAFLISASQSISASGFSFSWSSLSRSSPTS